MGGPTYDRGSSHGAQAGNDSNADRKSEKIVLAHEFPVLRFLFCPTSAADAVERNRTRAEKDQGESHGG
jgi:hypothetical protein